MNKFKTFTYKIDDETKLSKDKIINSINKFWKEHMSSLDSSKQAQLIYRIFYYKDNQRTTLVNNKSFTSEDKNLFKGLVVNIFKYHNTDTDTILINNFNTENLKNNIVKRIVIKYKITDREENLKKYNFTLKNYRIPMTMDLSKWGTILDFENALIIRKKNTNSLFKVIQASKFENIIELRDRNNNNILSFTDTRNEGDPINTFVRIFNNNIYFIYKGLSYFKLNKNNK